MHVWEKQDLGKAPYRVVGLYVMEFDQGILQERPPHGFHVGTCAVCGIGLKNNYLIISNDVKKFSVGCDCVVHSGDHNLSAEVKKIKRKLEKEQREKSRVTAYQIRQRQHEEKRDAAIIEFYNKKPKLCVFLLGYQTENPFIKDIISNLEKYGSLSAKQRMVVIRAMVKERKQANEPKEPVPNTGGRIWVSGTVLKVEMREGFRSEYLTRQVATIKDRRGFIVWGTLNEKIDVGDNVKFMCRVQPSDDKYFGFFKRPTKVSS